MNLSTHKKSEVDLRVTQELKNHQDFVYQTNQSLQNLKNEIFSQSFKHEKAISRYESRQKEIEIGFENLKEIVDEVCHDCIQNIGEMKTKINVLCKEVHDDIDKISKECVTIEAFNHSMDSLTDIRIGYGIQITRIEDDLKLTTNNTRSLFKVWIEDLRKDLTPVIPEVDPIQTKINEVKKILKVDLEGVAKEIFLLKKAIVYEQKRIENIYTLIERIKAGK